VLDDAPPLDHAQPLPAAEAADASDARQGGGSAQASAAGRLVRVERFFLDRFPVTNKLFQEFVAAGGYQQEALWEKAIWPLVPTLVDHSGAPGPRYWNKGRFPAGEEDFPVVGVSWYEAAACARWLGKRLPGDAEWLKAGSWPVSVSAAACSQRRYPWGNEMDLKRANLWGAGPNRIVPVHEFAEGMSVGGVYQMIGNVWEWTSGNFQGQIAGQSAAADNMKSIRGGAFDTYYDPQAVGQFQSGEDPLHRRHNIGFRCAVGASELMLSAAAATATATAPQQPPAAVEEVSI
jgi:iron(II)-dependent oxidoreductase